MRRCSALTAWLGSGNRGSISAKPSGDVGVEGPQGLRLGALGAAGAGAVVPCHHVEMRPEDVGIDEFLEIERGGDRAALRRFGDVVEIGDLAVEIAPIGSP